MYACVLRSDALRFLAIFCVASFLSSFVLYLNPPLPSFCRSQWFGELALGFGGSNASPASSPAPSPGAFPSPTSPGPSGFGAAATPRGAPRPRTATVVAKSRVVLLLALRGADFEALCAANPDVAHRVALRSAGYAAFDPPRDHERESAEAATAAAVAALSPLTLADLKPGRPLGSGAFGTVWLVTHGAKRCAGGRASTFTGFNLITLRPAMFFALPGSR